MDYWLYQRVDTGLLSFLNVYGSLLDIEDFISVVVAAISIKVLFWKFTDWKNQGKKKKFISCSRFLLVISRTDYEFLNSRFEFF